MKPFFIVGAPRSGTTMLRDLFRQVPNLYSPEETHYFRWAAPFKGNEYNSTYVNNKVLKMHRNIDGVDENDFNNIYDSSYTKSEITRKYCSFVAKSKSASTWFEKSPQNIYGLPLIAAQLPEAKVINITRHPYDVVKSLMVGKVIKVDNIIGAANYWNEAIDIASVCQSYLKDRMFSLKYEDLIKDPEKTILLLKDFLFIDADIDTSHLKSRSSDYTNMFSLEEREIIEKICGENMIKFGYISTLF